MSRREELWERFKTKAKELHGAKYTYKEGSYTCSRTLLPIWCNSCEKEFMQRPSAHLQGQTCPTCATISTTNKIRLPVESFKLRCGHVEDYASINFNSFTGVTEKLEINCHKHGKSYIKALQVYETEGRTHACSYCRDEATLKIRESGMLEKVLLKYPDLDVVDTGTYKNNKTKITIVCPLHGVYEKSYNKLLYKRDKPACQECNKELVGRWSQKNMLKNIDFFKGQRCYLYLLKVTGGGESFVKMGFSANIRDRLYTLTTDADRHYTFEVISKFEGNTYSCCGAETKIKKEIFSHRYLPERWFGGYTECYTTVGLDVKLFRELAQEQELTETTGEKK